MSDSLQNYFMYVGMATTACFAFLLFCTVALFALLLGDRWREHRKAQFAKHQKIVVPEEAEVLDFFGISMTEAQRREEREIQAALKKKRARNDETVIAFAGWDQDYPAEIPQEGTVSYPAFDMKGENIDSRGAHKA